MTIKLPLYILLILFGLVSANNLLFTSIREQYYQEKLIVDGNIPRNLNGTVFRNGFGKFEGNGFKFNHLFDSLSLILKFNIIDGEVYFKSRLLDSKYYNDSLIGEPLYRTLGGYTPRMTPKQELETKLHLMHDNLNANIIRIGDKLFAVSDLAGNIEIDPETLYDKGKYHFDKPYEHENIITSAHPVRWTANSRPDMVFNYEADIINMKYRLYFILENQKQNQKQNLIKNYFYDIPTTRFSFIHSFSMTQKYLIFIEYPIYWNIKAIYDSVVILPSLEWNQTDNSRIHIIDLTNLDFGLNITSILIHTKPFFALHHINAFELKSELADNIYLDLITYPNSSILDYFYMNNILKKTNETGFLGGNYTKIIINLDNKNKSNHYIKFIDEYYINDYIEMPTVNPKYRGLPYHHFYAFTSSGKLIKVNRITGEIMTWTREGRHIPTEPVFIPLDFTRRDKEKNKITKECCKNTLDDVGVVVSVVLDSLKNTSYLLFLDARTMKEIAVAWISIPIPMTCHGFFE